MTRDVPCTTEYVCVGITDIYLYMHISVGRENLEEGRDYLCFDNSST